MGEHWPRVWREAVEHVGRDSDPGLFDRIRDTAHGSPERAALLREASGPNVRDSFGRDTFADPAYRAWEDGCMDAFIASRPLVLKDSPEHRDLDALIPAWRAGLTRIVTIPCRGTHNRRIGINALLITDATRADSERFREALDSFA